MREVLNWTFDISLKVLDRLTSTAESSILFAVDRVSDQISTGFSGLMAMEQVGAKNQIQILCILLLNHSLTMFIMLFGQSLKAKNQQLRGSGSKDSLSSSSWWAFGALLALVALLLLWLVLHQGWSNSKTNGCMARCQMSRPCFSCQRGGLYGLTQPQLPRVSALPDHLPYAKPAMILPVPFPV